MRNWVSPLIKLLIFLVVTTLATYVLGATIANSSYGATYTYHAAISDVTGLELGDDVRIAGVRVGSVSNIQIKENAQNVGYAYVTFTVQKSTRLPRSAEVYLRYRNLVGQRYLDIEQGDSLNVVLAPNSTIPEQRTHPAVDLTYLFDGFGPLTQGLSAPQINQLSYNFIQTLQGEGGALESLLGTIADLTNTLADKDKVIGEVIDNLNSVLGAVSQRDSDLSTLIVQLKDFFTGLADDRNTIGNAIVGINHLAQSTTGLLSQVRGPFKQDVTAITKFVNVLNNNSGVLTYVIKQLPPTVAGLIRTADYGSWFNFYLCSGSGTLVLPGGVKKPVTIANSSQARCN